MLRKQRKTDRDNALYIHQVLDINQSNINEDRVSKKPTGDKPKWWKRLDEILNI